MSEWVLIAFLYLAGSAILIAELFLPAHGLLGLVGIAMLGFGLYETFLISETVGLLGLVILAVVLPVGLVVSIRTWHRTPVGRRISPPNPQLTMQDRMPVSEMEALVGTVGRSLTPLRPVGTCVFDGRRVECKAEYGMIERDVEVEGIRLVDRTLSVRRVNHSPDDVTKA